MGTNLVGIASGLFRVLHQVNHNMLIGSVAESVVSAMSLQKLVLGANRLSGTLPDDIGLLAKAKLMDVHANNLAGSIPYSIGRCPRLKDICAWENRFIGTLPTALRWLKHLANLRCKGTLLLAPSLTRKCQNSSAWGRS